MDTWPRKYDQFEDARYYGDTYQCSRIVPGLMKIIARPPHTVPFGPWEEEHVQGWHFLQDDGCIARIGPAPHPVQVGATYVHSAVAAPSLCERGLHGARSITSAICSYAPGSILSRVTLWGELEETNNYLEAKLVGRFRLVHALYNMEIPLISCAFSLVERFFASEFFAHHLAQLMRVQPETLTAHAALLPTVLRSAQSTDVVEIFDLSTSIKSAARSYYDAGKSHPYEERVWSLLAFCLPVGYNQSWQMPDRKIQAYPVSVHPVKSLRLMLQHIASLTQMYAKLQWRTVYLEFSDHVEASLQAAVASGTYTIASETEHTTT